jgi:hypothetical protein
MFIFFESFFYTIAFPVGSFLELNTHPMSSSSNKSIQVRFSLHYFGGREKHTSGQPSETRTPTPESSLKREMGEMGNRRMDPLISFSSSSRGVANRLFTEIQWTPKGPGCSSCRGAK